MTQTTVLIADDHELLLDGLQLLLRKETWLKVVGTASNGRELIHQAEALQPDVILTDIVMPVMTGVEATRHISEKFPHISIVALSMFNEETMITQMLEAGAIGYLIKNADKEEILEAIRRVSQKKPYYCRMASTTLASITAKVARTITNGQHHHKFSERELEIIRLTYEEKTSAEISKVLFLSPRTVEGLRLKIYEKMGVTNKKGMVSYALTYNLISSE